MIIALIIFLSLLLGASVYWNVIITRRALMIDNVLINGGAAIEECLDIINISYGVVGKILQMPLASNDNKIIQIHKELKRVHGNLLVVASKIAQSWDNQEEEKAPASDTD